MRSAYHSTTTYYIAVAFALLFGAAHIVALPLRISYDGLGYLDLADILGSSRFPHEWHPIRTPLFPLALKMSFWAFGRQPAAAVLVTSSLALAGILVLGAAVRRLAGPIPAAIGIVALAAFPTLVAYEHSVLTEAGSFFFIATVVYLLVLDGRRAGLRWLIAAAIVATLTAGYYWRANIIALAPVAAALHLASASSGAFATAGLRARWRRLSSPLAQAGIIAGAPFVLAGLWSPYVNQPGLRDVTLRLGMIRQALLPPEHSLVGEHAGLYYRSIRESLHDGNFYSGIRWHLLTRLQAEIFSRPLGQTTPNLFLSLVRTYPDRYARGFVRTVAFFSGANGAESDNRICRDEVLTPGSKISEGPEPLRTRIRNEFEQRPAPSALMKVLGKMAPLYDLWLIPAHLITAAGLILALALRNIRLFTCCAVPLAYGLSYAVLLVSLDRFVAPVHPIILVDSFLVPLLVWRTLAGRSGRGTAPVQAAGRDQSLDADQNSRPCG